MKRPTWVTIVGVLGIIFGVSGLFSSAQTAMMPKMMQIQKGVMENIQNAAAAQNPQQQQAVMQFDKAMGSIWGDVPSWAETAAVILGVVGLFVNATYLFSAIALLQIKRYAIRLFYWSVSASILAAAVRAVVFSKAFSGMGIAMSLGIMVGAVLDLVLFIVVFTADKSAFETEVNG